MLWKLLWYRPDDGGAGGAGGGDDGGAGGDGGQGPGQGSGGGDHTRSDGGAGGEPGPVPYGRFKEILDERNQLKERIAELEKGRSDLEKVSERLAAIERERDQERAQRQRLEVATKKGLPAELAERLQGTTPEELEADADRLLQFVKASSGGPGVPPPSRGGKPTTLDLASMSPEEIRKNRDKLWKQSRRR